MKIGEISRITKISESTLRYYEKKGLIKVERDENGIRNYLESDIEWLFFIKRLKDTRMLLRDIREYSELRYEGDTTVSKRLDILLKHREFILDERDKLEDNIDKLNKKIDIYREKLVNK